MRSKKLQQAFSKLESAERRFFAGQFLAPAVPGGTVRVRIEGVVCTMRIGPGDLRGFGVFRPTSPKQAELVRPASLAERKAYLELFPLVRLILALPEGGHWLAAAAHRGDRRLRIAGLAAVRLVEEGEPFCLIRARFDGENFWYQDVDRARDPATAAWLRQSLLSMVPPNQLDRPGLTPEERGVYELRYELLEKVRLARAAAQTEQRLRAALRHAGAELVEFLERRDSFRVTYEVAGRQHVSAVDKDNLAVQVAGICLAGEDQKFDLASLVGVIREAQGGGGFVPIGAENQGMNEETYWRVHPPQNE